MRKLPIILALLTIVAFGGTMLRAGDITDTGMSQKDIVQFLTNCRNSINNRVMSSATVTYNNSTPTYLTASAVTAVVEGAIITTTATNTISFSTGHVSLGASKACYFGLCVASSGAYTTIQGPVCSSSETPVYPTPVSSKAVLGLVKIVTNSTGAFVPRTTNMNAASVTTTITNVSFIPVSLTGL